MNATANEEIKITRIIVPFGQTIQKAADNRSFFINVQYELENGKIEDAVIQRMRKKDVKAAIEREPVNLYAWYSATGVFMGTRSIINIG